jgi:hypothetical protein
LYNCHPEAIKKGSEIVIKQPYKKISFNGSIKLRNDNPKNLIFLQSDGSVLKDSLRLKEIGNEFLKTNQLVNAIKFYFDALGSAQKSFQESSKDALESKKDDLKIIFTILNNLS